MAYDELLATRLRALLAGHEGVSEQRMFGGLAFLVEGTMAVSASSRGGLLLRVDPAQTASLVAAGVDRFVMRGRAMDGWLHVEPDVVATDQELERWVAIGVAYAGSRPRRR